MTPFSFSYTYALPAGAGEYVCAQLMARVGRPNAAPVGGFPVGRAILSEMRFVCHGGGDVVVTDTWEVSFS